ncbi:MAG: L-threonylcarbamoyladenylate synthase [Myxococcales bacterium]|nr:L-threonylcarbamoyladenylate synthase [Myxococcales bacterium]
MSTTVDYSRYAALLRSGGVLACPTETLMGLLADALDVEAVERVRTLKRRPEGMPIALLVPDLDAVAKVASHIPEAVRQLARRHWPGPLTMLVPAAAHVPALLVRDGCVGVRVPGASPALELVRAFGGPLTATSANLSSEPPVRDADEARAVFGTALAGVVPGVPPGGEPSTIVDVRCEPPRIVRAGAVTIELGE